MRVPTYSNLSNFSAEVLKDSLLSMEFEVKGPSTRLSKILTGTLFLMDEIYIYTQLM